MPSLSASYTSWDLNTAHTSLLHYTNLTMSTRALTADQIGAGRAVYIGFNVFGPDAGPNDLRLLQNAIEWTVTVAVVPEPSTLALSGVSLIGLAAHGWRRRRQMA